MQTKIKMSVSQALNIIEDNKIECISCPAQLICLASVDAGHQPCNCQDVVLMAGRVAVSNLRHKIDTKNQQIEKLSSTLKDAVSRLGD